MFVHTLEEAEFNRVVSECGMWGYADPSLLDGIGIMDSRSSWYCEGRRGGSFREFFMWNEADGQLAIHHFCHVSRGAFTSASMS